MKLNGSFQNLNFSENNFVRDFIRDSIRDSTRDFIRDSIRDCIRDSIRDFIRVQGRHKNSRTKKQPEQPEAKILNTAGGE